MTGKKALLLSTDTDRLSLLSGLLRDDGFEVITGKSGETGLLLADTERPDIIVADLVLPTMDAYQLYRTLRSPEYSYLVDTPFIFLSADPEALSTLRDEQTDVLWPPADGLSQRALLCKMRKMVGLQVDEDISETYCGTVLKVFIYSHNTDLVNHLRTCLGEDDRYDMAVVLDRDELIARNEATLIPFLFIDIAVTDEPSIEYLLKKMRIKNSSLRIIVISTKESISNALCLFKHGANDYLVLPFTEKELRDSMRIVTEVVDHSAAVSVISERISELNLQLQYKNLELTLLQKIAAELSHRDNPDELAEIILTGLRELVDYDVSTIMLLEGSTLYVVAERGFPDSQTALELQFDTDSNPRIKRVVEEKKAFIFRDPNEVDPFDGILQVKKVHSCLIAPMYLGDRMLGILTLDKQIPGLYDDETIRLVSILAHHAAISFERAERHETLEKLASTDGLTGLYNRRSLDIAIAREEARLKRNRVPSSVVMVDADGVKLVNDRYGHEAGDAFLKRIADILKGNCRVTDVVCRYGGDEFVILMPETTGGGAKRFINLVTRKMDTDPGFQIDEELRLTVSIGAACSTETGSIDEALKLADERMYESKRLRKASRNDQDQS
ncbi:MAG: diguanylate cyclase [Nitrospirota bacterium]|nr:diguanylate cyclase [Nitrospirota bacterium]